MQYNNKKKQLEMQYTQYHTQVWLLILQQISQIPTTNANSGINDVVMLYVHTMLRKLL